MISRELSDLADSNISLQQILTICDKIHTKTFKEQKQLVHELLHHPMNSTTSLIESQVILELIANNIMHRLDYTEIIALIPHIVHGGTQKQFIFFMRHFTIKPLHWFRIVNAYNEAELSAACRLGYRPHLIDDSFYGDGKIIV